MAMASADDGYRAAMNKRWASLIVVWAAFLDVNRFVRGCPRWFMDFCVSVFYRVRTPYLRGEPFDVSIHVRCTIDVRSRSDRCTIAIRLDTIDPIGVRSRYDR